MADWATSEDGTHIAWSQHGTGEPLLLISGQAVDSSSWEAVLPDFAAEYRVITFDHRGVGHSDPGPDIGYSTHSFARDAIAVLDAAGASVAHVYGHSMGGRIAQWVAINHAERVASLILGATTGGDERGVERSGSATADLLSGEPDLLARLFFRSGEQRVDARAFFASTASTHARRLHFAASRDHDAWDELASIVAPTLVIHGSEDELTPAENGRRIAAAIPGAEFELRRGYRHGYFLEDPEATAAVLGFMAKHPLR